MKPYGVQSVMIERPPDVVFGYVADPKNLPAWTSAFKSATASEGRYSRRRRAKSR